MQVQPIKQQNIDTSRQLSHKGAADVTLRYLATNQAIGANLMDFCSMVAPRTINDGIKRGPAAGMETGRREIMGTVNDSCVGLFGAAAGAAIAGSLTKKYETKVNKIFTAPDTLHILADNKAKQLENNKTQIEYIKETLRHAKGYNPTHAEADNDGFVKLSEKTIDTVAKYYDELLNKKADFSKWTSSKADRSRTVMIHVRL